MGKRKLRRKTTECAQVSALWDVVVGYTRRIVLISIVLVFHERYCHDIDVCPVQICPQYEYKKAEGNNYLEAVLSECIQIATFVCPCRQDCLRPLRKVIKIVADRVVLRRRR